MRQLIFTLNGSYNTSFNNKKTFEVIIIIYYIIAIDVQTEKRNISSNNSKKMQLQYSGISMFSMASKTCCMLVDFFSKWSKAIPVIKSAVDTAAMFQ